MPTLFLLGLPRCCEWGPSVTEGLDGVVRSEGVAAPKLRNVVQVGWCAGMSWEDELDDFLLEELDDAGCFLAAVGNGELEVCC